MGSLDEFEDKDSYELVDELTAQAKAIEEKYSTKKDFDYNKALKIILIFISHSLMLLLLNLRTATNRMTNF